MRTTIHSNHTKSERTIQALLPITKSEYLQYLACAPEFWYSKHCPDDFSGAPDEESLHIMQQGYAIEALARTYFKPSKNLTVEFQRNFRSDKLLARADIVLTDQRTGIKTLIEVKSGTEVKPEYLDDLAFQVIAASAVGMRMDRVGVLHVDGDYVRSGTIDPQKFFVFEDVTDAVKALVPETRKNIEAAIIYLAKEEPVMHLHEYCGQKLDCPALQRQHPKLPEYSVFNINRIHPAKLRTLLEKSLVDIHHVPKDFNLSEKQRLQVQVAQSGKPHICQGSIQQALGSLQFPLYFLDYETLQYGIPQFDGIKPYQQMVFQWSLHVMHEADGGAVHVEFLSDGTEQPAMEFAQTLYEAIPQNGGTVLVWNKSFEMARNRELAQMYPQFEAFFTDLNERVFDLMEIFQQQHFVHPEFKGSCSIKNILPVLAPHLSYADLEINHGMLASIRWFELITGKIPVSEKARVLDCMRQYCKLDTLAMVEVYNYLRSAI
jgi:hypothetical protein